MKLFDLGENLSRECSNNVDVALSTGYTFVNKPPDPAELEDWIPCIKMMSAACGCAGD